MDGYISYTLGSGGSWIAWHTESKPTENATGRDLAASPGAVQFAIGPSPEAAFEKLKSELSTTKARPSKSTKGKAS